MRELKIDWLSFSFPVRGRDNEPLNERDVMASLCRYAQGRPDLHAALMDRDATDLTYGRAPYTSRIKWDGGLGDVFFSPSLTHATVELSGSAWDRWEATGFMYDWLSVAAKSVTRIDIAHDIATAVLPSEFVERMGKGGRMQKSVIRSQSGQTCYVGSPKSEMYTRVYRYAEPHPRAALLRVENVIRKKYARKLIPAILAGGLLAVGNGLNERYGWDPELWGEGVSMRVDMDGVRPEGGHKATVSWLIRQAAPAFKRLVAEGVIGDPVAFLEQYFGVE